MLWARTAVLAVLLPLAPTAPAYQHPGTVRFLFDDNRIFVPLDFVRADGSIRRALAYVDVGTPAPMVTAALAHDLDLDRQDSARIDIGGLRITIPASRLVVSPESFGRTGPHGRATEPVEAILSGSMLEKYVVRIDYAGRTLGIAPSGEIPLVGISVPCDVNATTGLIAVRAEVDHRPFDVAIDFGSAYTWVRADTAGIWASMHPAWLRGRGAIGESNMQTRKPEATATILRVPEIRIGELRLRDVGVLGITPELPPFPPTPGGARLTTGDMFDWYSAKAPRPVIGWIGANALKSYQITIDYPRHTVWWEQQREPDRHDLDQVGITLEDEDGGYVVSGVSQRAGHPTVQGVEPGDRLLRIDSLDVRGATRGAIFGALHGVPGTTKTLTLDRDGLIIHVRAPVAAF